MQQVTQGFRHGISIVMTVFNKATSLPLVFEAIGRQQCPVPLELVIVDDGSTDNSLEVIAGLLPSLPASLENILVVTRENGGPSAAMNLGLSLCRTTWVKGLDGDDILTPDSLATLLAALQALPGCRWAYGLAGTYDSFPPDPGVLFAGVPVAPPPVKRDDQLRRSLRLSHTNPSGWLAETDFVNSLGGCDPRIFVQDYSLELRMAAASPAAFVEGPVYFYHADIGSGRVSASGRQILHDVNMAVANLFADRPELLDGWGAEAARRVAGRAWHWARRHEGCGLLSQVYLDFVSSRLRLGNPQKIMQRSYGAIARGVRRPLPGDGSCRPVVARGAFAPEG